ncbi:hypothetical protein DMC30DRAFT_357131 [Rhodotorula diobovata]|uniref:TauD/TfdA-like domain-containing protein n=1 Tax=Rhodotorula diobovata TaxID=5288 RepID=A0A5C5FL16_9BASI|nr:hypothetical protein DMC30DRAFT_357131 [Rhodotorula diobovata]
MTTQAQTLTAAIGSLSLSGAAVSPLEPTGVLDQYKPVDLTPIIGRQFSELQLKKLLYAPNSDELLRELAITIHRRNVVFFKTQEEQLTDPELKTLARKLGQLTGGEGRLHIHPTEIDREDKEISPIKATDFKRHRGQGSQLASRGWHSDITFEPVPSDIAILTLTEIPASGGGDTLWASAYELYDRLTPAFASFLEGLTALHSGAHFVEVAEARDVPLYTDERGHPDNVGDKLEDLHPVVRINPRALTLLHARRLLRRIVELNQDESDRILSYLGALVKENHDLQVRFTWATNDVALWSNTSSLHNVTLDFAGTDRVGHRVVSLGDKPVSSRDVGGRSRREALGLPKWLED